MKQNNRTQWRSLDARDPSDQQLDAWKNEFPEGSSEMTLEEVTRRQFLGIMGASTALAGVGLQGCIRKPEEHILPYSERPEDVVPGEARYYATNLHVAGSLQPALIETHGERPTKIEGNPRDPRTKGATSPFAQGEILRLYDPARLQKPSNTDGSLTLEAAREELNNIRQELNANGGQGVALVAPNTPSPTLNSQLSAFIRTFPNARVFRHDATTTGNRRQALTQMGSATAELDVDLSGTEVIVSLDSDFLQTEEGAVANTQAYSEGRTIDDNLEMSRLYVIEPGYSASGMNADNHLSLASSQIGAFAQALAAAVGVSGVSGQAPEGTDTWIQAIASDLKESAGKTAVLAGESQPSWVHVVVAAINEALGNVGNSIRYFERENAPELEPATALPTALNSGDITTVITLGTNPLLGSIASEELAQSLDNVDRLVSLAYYKDETASRADIVVPESHPLESWGDLLAADGRGGVQQPLIAPLYSSMSAIEFLELLVSKAPSSAHSLVQKTWRNTAHGGSWKKLLHDGLVPSPSAKAASITPASALSSAVSKAESYDAPGDNTYELSFSLDPTILDGRYANLSWMQELPSPVTKLTWDNAALMNTTTAEALGIDWEDCLYKGQYNARKIELSTDQGSITVPAFILPGVADYVIQLTPGYGRDYGPVATGAGVDVSPVRTSTTPSFTTGASVKRVSGTYKLASTQDHWTLVPRDNENFARPIAREATLEEYLEDPHFVEEQDLMEASHIKSLWTEPNPRKGQQWGMTIDLNTCTGCGACTVACQAENNIPSVGKEQVLNGREMHWIRIDRYFVGPEDHAQVINQPVNCMQCENAPCEQVCPVAATVHSPSGLNDMVYNRCIGTRYCANNCPYKVRRFNFFNFQKYARKDNPLIELQRNPDVTPRFRGVMEKCTYCVQRINAARIDAKTEGSGIVPDGAIQTACQQACPAQAIVFGSISSADSAVSRAKASPRNYSLLSYLNTQPRTTYLAKLRNPNPELV